MIHVFGMILKYLDQRDLKIEKKAYLILYHKVVEIQLLPIVVQENM
ncbi:hypothetical protein SDC9_164301 [bioreactor metagenome]|uniref:Uncharacterized protein n=1 Tax=bioreactor metagenome TaxID=1076179 RepID=A0A645FTH3_9ZZZZ